VQAQVLYQLDYRPASSSAAWSSRLSQQQLVEITNLQPGTKYMFRARGGYAAPDAVQRADAASEAAGDDAGGAAAAADEGVSWGDFSVESSYATSGACHSGCWFVCLFVWLFGCWCDRLSIVRGKGGQ
jgi:hypothetical protein